jgi:hypothetical protein
MMVMLMHLLILAGFVGCSRFHDSYRELYFARFTEAELHGKAFTGF